MGSVCGSCVFFVKQKTAYEMRISDWSSDVCSSDLVEAQEQQQLLLREMNHRIKNLLTLSSGLVSLSACYAETPAELATAVQERLQALARAQEMILPDTAADAIGEANRGTTLRALIATVVSPFEIGRASCGERVCL